MRLRSNPKSSKVADSLPQLSKLVAKLTGFTMIEVLVALAIISITLIAAMRVSATSTSSAEVLRNRLLGGWVAENVLAKQRATRAWLEIGSMNGSEKQAGVNFNWRADIITTPNPFFRRVDVYVFAAPEAKYWVAHLVGFLVQGQADNL